MNALTHIPPSAPETFAALRQQYPVGTVIRYWKGTPECGPGFIGAVTQPGVHLLGNLICVKVGSDTIAVSHLRPAIVQETLQYLTNRMVVATAYLDDGNTDAARDALAEAYRLICDANIPVMGGARMEASHV